MNNKVYSCLYNCNITINILFLLYFFFINSFGDKNVVGCNNEKI